MNDHDPPSEIAEIAFVNQLAVRFPEAARVIHARRQEERGEILPYVELWQLVLWLGSMQARTRGAGLEAERARTQVREFLDALENGFEVGNEDVSTLIAVGFLEKLRNTEDEFPALRALLPPRMSAWFARYLE